MYSKLETDICVLKVVYYEIIFLLLCLFIFRKINSTGKNGRLEKNGHLNLEFLETQETQESIFKKSVFHKNGHFQHVQ